MRKKTKLNTILRGSEWGYLDNTKHLIFGVCSIKQLNFKHFNTNSKKFTVTVNFIRKETKTAPKRPKLFCLVYQEVFGHLPTIPDHIGRFPKTTEDSRRLPKILEDYRRCLETTEDVRRLPKMPEDNRRFPRRNVKNVGYIFVIIFTCEIYFLQCKDKIFSVREIVVIHSN